MTRSAGWRLTLAACLLACAGVNAQQPVRDSAAVAVAGTAVLTGTVVIDEAGARPVRRALVTLAGSARGSGNTAVTDDAGRFAFTALPAGQYRLTASRPGYVSASYGATRPGRPGMPIQLAGQRPTTVMIKMARGAVVTGTILDQNGEPLPAARVSLMRYVYSAQNGERTLQSAGGSGSSDDRGTYRIYGITPGEYLVQLAPRFALPGVLRQTTAQSMQAALQQLRSTTTAAQSAAERVEAPTVGYAPIFYPGSTSPASATSVKLAAGEERTGVDIQMQMVPTAKIEGVVVGPDGLPAPNAQLSVITTGQTEPSMSAALSVFGQNRPRSDGTFSLSGLAPGQYTIAARTGTAGRPGGPAPSTTPVLWATAEVGLNGQDVSNVRLALEPGMTVSGRVTFDGAPPPQNLATVQVRLTPILSGGAVAVVMPPSQTDAQGRFTFRDVAPGRYRFAATLGAGGAGGGPAVPWAFKSAMARGRETLDAALEVRANENVTDAVLTFSDRTTEVSGMLQDATGRPGSDYFVILYAADKAYWPSPTRRVAASRPGIDGRFTFRNLPPGDYLLAAVVDIEPGEWNDPDFLAQLVTASIKVSFEEGEKKAQDIRIAGSR